MAEKPGVTHTFKIYYCRLVDLSDVNQLLISIQDGLDKMTPKEICVV